jgi:hypothetical protein
MAYVAIGILFLLVVAAGVTLFVLANVRKSAPATAEDENAAATPFSGPDHTPVGDTAEHAGQQDEEGRTTSPNDATRAGGTGAPTSGPQAGGHGPAREAEGPPAGRFKRDPVGGEAEGEPTAPVGDVPHQNRH